MALKVCNTYQNEEEQKQLDQLLSQEQQQQQQQQQQREKEGVKEEEEKEEQQTREQRAARANEAKELLDRIVCLARENLSQEEQDQLLSQGDDDEACWSEDELAILKSYCELVSDTEEEEGSLEKLVARIVQNSNEISSKCKLK